MGRVFFIVSTGKKLLIECLWRRKNFDMLRRVSLGDSQHTTCIVETHPETLLLGVCATCISMFLLSRL